MPTSLEAYFRPFREQIVGIDQTLQTALGELALHYAVWTACGRLYAPIEKALVERFGPFVANTHSESNTTGTLMTRAYQAAQAIIKRHVNAGPGDVIITQGSGMTAMINKSSWRAT